MVRTLCALGHRRLSRSGWLALAAATLAAVTWAGALLSGSVASAAADEDAEGLNAVLELVASVDDADLQFDLLKGTSEALQGRKRMDAPAAWQAAGPKLLASTDARVLRLAQELAVLFGDPRAVESIRKTMLDAKAVPQRRREALQALLERKVAGLDADALRLLDDQALRSDAIRALATYHHADTAQAILSRYGRLTPSERNDAVNTLASRPEWALALLDAIGRGSVPSSDLPAFTARQLAKFGDKAIDEKLRQVWGTIRETSQQKAQLVEHYKQLLTQESLLKANAGLGRVVYNRICGQCHKLYGEGGTIGPDLTGSNRKNIDYLLENLLDPSALIARDYKLTNILTADGRLLSGIVRRENERVVVLQTVNETVTLERAEIEELEPSPQSMMPEGILDRLTPEELQGLVVYLVSSEQVPLPASE